MDEHERKMYAQHDAILREERIVTILFRVFAVVTGALATLGLWWGW